MEGEDIEHLSLGIILFWADRVIDIVCWQVTTKYDKNIIQIRLDYETLEDSSTFQQNF